MIDIGSPRRGALAAAGLALAATAPAWAGTTERVNVGPHGVQANEGDVSDIPHDVAISATGRFVVFDSQATNLVPGDTNGFPDVFVRDRKTSTTERVSVSSIGEQGNAVSGSGYRPSISADGRFVAFGSGASNLVPGDTNGFPDVFVRD